LALATSFETAKMGMTRSGAFVGTPKYMSPEQVEGGTVDNAAVTFIRWGLVIYEWRRAKCPSPVNPPAGDVPAG